MSAVYDFPEAFELRARTMEIPKDEHDKRCIQVILYRVQEAIRNGKDNIEVDGRVLPSDHEAFLAMLQNKGYRISRWVNVDSGSIDRVIIRW